MDWTLERINVQKNFIVLKRNVRSYPCGRGPVNLIVCPSLVVSRRHCIFVRTEDVISVIDLGSVNGVYVNGTLLEPNVLVELHENDVIGIGSLEHFRDDEPMFVYKLHKGNLESRNLKEFDELSTQRSSNDRQAAGSLKRNLAEKRDEASSAKIIKLRNGFDEAAEKDVRSSGSTTEYPEVAELLEAEEIEEVWSTLSPQISEKPKTHESSAISDQKPGNSGRSNRMTLNIDKEKEQKSLSRNIDLRNGEMELTSGGRLKPSKEMKQKKPRDVEVLPIVLKPQEPENSHKTIHLSIDSTTSATRFTVDIMQRNVKDSGVNERVKKAITEDSSERDRRRSENRETRKKKTPIPEAEKIEEQEEVVEANKSSSQSSRFSFLNKDPAATSSPFKIKQVKQEPMTSFTLYDTVDLSDDDDYVFPSSQLFDSNAEEPVMKNEEDEGLVSLKDDPLDDDDKDMFASLDAVAEESEDIIVLSDSEDEDNPWLKRLSESQRIKEEALEVPEMPPSPKMEFVDEIIEPECHFAPTVPEAEAPKESPKKPSPTVLPNATKPRPLTLAEIEKDVNASELESSGDEFNSVTSVQTEKKKESWNKKGPKLIEPLHLPQKKRLSLKDSLSDPDSPVTPKPSTSKNYKVIDCSVEVPKLPSNLTTRQKRELQLQDKIKQKTYEAEQKTRRTKNKWAQNVQLPLGKRKSLPLSKSQKLEIKTERKEKLKALAKKEKESIVKPTVERVVTAKPKAKVSTKSRGDFLIAEELRLEKTKAIPDPAEPSTSRKDEAKSSKSSMSSSRRSEDKEKPSKEKKESRRSKDKEKPSKENKESRSELSSSKHRKRDKSQKTTDEWSKSMEKVAIEAPKVVQGLPVQKENREPNSSPETKKRDKAKGKKKKNVSFSDKLVEVREFQIISTNTMRKCVGKDALIPKDKIHGARKVDRAQSPKLEEFLMDIFNWNPSWLEEQKRLQTEPPVVVENLLVPLLTSYRSYIDYYRILMPVLLLELWHSLTKEFESIDKNNRRRVMFCSIVNNSVTSQPIPSTDMHLTTMLLEVLASEEDVRMQRHPVYGDLIFLELRYRDEEGKLKILKVFAYVTQLHQTPITPNTFFNRDLMGCTLNASKVLTYSVLTRPLKINLCINQVIRLRCVMYLRAEMRMVQALQSLPNSPLMDLILHPKVEQYHLSLPAKHQQAHLITGDKLNHRQVEAVFKVTEAIVKKEPKLCLVQGPPGTGKSEVIVNMVMQVLYGDNRYRNKETSFRILLCAPSNAAIDEIVMRLLDRRAKLSNDRFKMVRVGLIGSMHPRVKDISMEELARREVKRTIAGYQSHGGALNGIEEEKRILEATMNKLQLELSSLQKDEKKTQLRKMKLADARLKYDLINNCAQSTSSTINPREMIKLQKAAESQLLVGADIIACTLSSCYTNIMESAFGNTLSKISVCIVDEATQSCEAETLIPLMLGVNTLVLVGDPAQLPATVISQRAKNLGLDQSLFSRTQRAFEGQMNSPVIMLDLQYRMHVEILSWPNRYFYNGKLRNGLVGVEPSLPLHPYRVINLDSQQNSDKFSNTQEAEFVASLVSSVVNHLEVKQVAQISIGVITPYRNQHAIVQAKIMERLSPLLENLKIGVSLAVNTVDSFQGHERDVIIMSCVRTNGIGFLADQQRLCVALTRAKHCLVLCGNFATFQRNLMWRSLLTDAQTRKSYVEMKSDARGSDIVSQLVR